MEYWEEKVELARAIKYHLYGTDKLKPCMWCGIHLEFDAATIEHIKPDSHGGPLALSNSGVACNSCNQKRGTRSPEIFLTSSWLLEKRRQVQAQKNNRKIPCHPDGIEMSDSEIRLASHIYLNVLTKSDLIAIIMGMAKPGHLDRWAHHFQELNQ
jgi:hypothetical protein